MPVDESYCFFWEKGLNYFGDHSHPLGSRNELRVSTMDPIPIKHPGVLLARIRKAVEPRLLAAGFKCDGRNKPASPVYIYIDYSRPGQLLRIAWDRRDSNSFIGLTAEAIKESSAIQEVARVDLSRLGAIPKVRAAAELEKEIDEFVRSIKDNLALGSE